MKYQLVWLNLIEKLLSTGLYDHGMIKDDQTSNKNNWIEFEIEIVIEFLAQKYQDEFLRRYSERSWNTHRLNE